MRFMRFIQRLLGIETNEDRVAYAEKIISRVRGKICAKYGDDNIKTYLSLYTAGQFMRESMESGKYEHYSENYRGTEQQALMQKYLKEGIENLIENGLPPDEAERYVQSRFNELEAMAVNATITFVGINRKANPNTAAFFFALRDFYNHAEAEMRKDFGQHYGNRN